MTNTGRLCSTVASPVRVIPTMGKKARKNRRRTRTAQAQPVVRTGRAPADHGVLADTGARVPMTGPYRLNRAGARAEPVFERGPWRTHVARNDPSPWPAGKAWGVLLSIAGVFPPDALARSALSASGAEAGPAAGMISGAYFPLLAAQSLWLVLVGVATLVLSRWSASAREGELRGLNLARGSIRAMPAVLVAGTLMNFLVFGGSAFDGEDFDGILAVLAGLTGAVIALCFRGRSAGLAALDSSCGDSE